ncbi:MAG: alpha-amylase family glycosyl hydrolase [Faecousia sp.]
MKLKITEYDPSLKPFQKDLELRMENLQRTKNRILKDGETLAEFANGHMFFGFHKTVDGWYYREWAPAAEEMYLTGDFNYWNRRSHPMQKKDNGVWEIFLPGTDALKDGQRIGCIVVHNGQDLDRIPSYANYVVQETGGISWSAVIHAPEKPYAWTDSGFLPEKNLFIYECHIGMAQEEGKVGSYTEFRDNILPRIHDLGYNTIQIMAIMEHPYYASFGYQVCNFFAASSRFGTPEELKSLIDTAHGMGIAVLLDVVHSHCAPNSREGLNLFDGTSYQYFHDGGKGNHSAWGTKCFNYGKPEVIHFLLSNLKFWMDEYHFDGFRFDGVTSMLYHDHGLGVAFTGPEKYFSMNTDTEAVTYLQLASQLVRQVNPNAILIAEDMSAMPGMCLPIEDGGIGFDYRLAMGEPDMWIRLLKERKDEDWDLNQIYYELANRRPHEKVIGYCESHDQALVGDKTIMFRLCDAEMYTGMGSGGCSMVIDRGMALHKMLRLLTMSLGGNGYLTFMGNEFGHPEWIDFPREGNGWSYHYCRRQWSLADNPDNKYRFLNLFEKDMVAEAKKDHVLDGWDKQLLVHNGDNVMAYQKGDGVFIFNFDPTRCYDGYLVPMAEEGDYQVSLSTDDFCYGGHGRVARMVYTAAKQPDGRTGFQIYLPNRTGIVLRKVSRK